MVTKEKNLAELEIEALADVFNIATTGFEEFYKSAKKSASSGNHSKSASSIAVLTKGQYGADKFYEKVKEAI